MPRVRHAPAPFFFLALLLLFTLFIPPPLLAADPLPPAQLTADDRQALEAEAKRLWDEAQRLDKEGKVAEALRMGEQMLAAAQKLLGDQDKSIVIGRNWLADRYERLEDFPAAARHRALVVEIQTQRFGKDHWQVTDARWALHDTELLATITPDKRLQLDVARARYVDARRLYDEGKFADGARSAQDAADINKAIVGENHAHYAASLSILAENYHQQGDYARAETLFREALEIRRKALGENHPDVAQSLNSLARTHKTLGSYGQSEPLYRQALEIFKKTLSEDSADYATTLGNLALLYLAQSDFKRAEPLFRHSLEITKKILGKNHPDYAGSLNSLGGLYLEQGDYARAEPIFREAAETVKTALGETHPFYAFCLNNSASLYQKQGDFVRAEPLLRQVLEISKNLGENHPEYATSLNGLATNYQVQGDFARAEPLFRQALEIRLKVLGGNHPDCAHSLNNLATIYRAQENYAKAEPLIRQALEISKKSVGENHPGYAASLQSLAALYTAQGENEKAERLVRQVLEIRRKSLGENHPDVAASLNDLADLYVMQGKFAQAEAHFHQALEITLGNLELAAAAQSERGQIAMAFHVRHRLERYLALATHENDFSAPAYQHLLAWKGVVLARQQAIKVAADRPDLAPLAAELKGAASRLATLSLATPRPEQTATWREAIATLSSKKEDLEQKLSAASAEYRAAIKPVTVADVQAALPPDGALVDLLEYWHMEYKAEEQGGGWNWERRVAAFVVRPQGNVKLVALIEAESIRDSIDAWRNGFGNSAESREASKLLREKLWRPIEEHLGGIETVLISPEGDLGKLPFAALPGKEPGTYLLEDYTLAVVPAAASLVRSRRDRMDQQAEVATGEGVVNAKSGPPRDPHAKRTDHIAGNLLVLGGVDYDRTSGSSSAEQDPKQALADNRRAARDNQDKPFAPLAGTKGELDTVEKLYRNNFGNAGLRSLVGASATQDSLVELAPQHLYLHLATHGYFASPRFKSALERSTQDQKRGSELFVSNQSLAGYHPGLLSGIALAGANQPTDEDDGILTAEEIGALNLSGCELVVLSACETGLGQAAGGEGLLGLQRSFQVARAKTLVASLWKVDDDATRVLMVEFYRNLWEKKLSKVEALRQAQLAMLARYDLQSRTLLPRGATPVEADLKTAGEKRLPPYYWAAFVLSGDWR